MKRKKILFICGHKSHSNSTSTSIKYTKVLLDVPINTNLIQAFLSTQHRTQLVLRGAYKGKKESSKRLLARGGKEGPSEMTFLSLVKSSV
jgi:hypothetical protein